MACCALLTYKHSLACHAARSAGGLFLSMSVLGRLAKGQSDPYLARVAWSSQRFRRNGSEQWPIFSRPQPWSLGCSATTAPGAALESGGCGPSKFNTILPLGRSRCAVDPFLTPPRSALSQHTVNCIPALQAHCRCMNRAALRGSCVVVSTHTESTTYGVCASHIASMHSVETDRDRMQCGDGDEQSSIDPHPRASAAERRPRNVSVTA